MKLWTPEEPLIKGRSMVGYSRRSMLGFLGLGALTASIPVQSLPLGYTSLSGLFDGMAIAARMTWEINPDIVFGQFRSFIPFRIGQSVQIDLNDGPKTFLVKDIGVSTSGMVEVTAELTPREEISQKCA